MFHDANPSSGHYDPLLYNKLTICNFEPCSTYLSLICKELEHNWNCIANDMKLHGLNTTTRYISKCGDNLFNSICHLIETEFTVQSLRLYIAQSFRNAIMAGNKFAMHCLREHLSTDVIHKMKAITIGKDI